MTVYVIDLLHGLREASHAFVSTFAYEYRLNRHRRWRRKHPLRPARHVTGVFIEREEVTE